MRRALSTIVLRGTLLGIAAMALAIAGCGGDDDNPDATGGGNADPVASFTMSPTCTASNTTPVTFTSTSSDADGDTITCAWTFASGTPSSGNTCVVTGVTYPNFMPYAVTLMVSDGNGGTDSLQQSIAPCP